MPRLGRARPHKPLIGRAALPVSSLTAGSASFVSSGPGGIGVLATAPTGGSPGYTYQWERNANGGSYSDLAGANSLSLTDATASSGVLYGYRCKQTDGASVTVTTNSVFAQVYSGGPMSAGGSSSVFRSGVFS